MIFVFAGIVALAISVILGVFGIPLLSKIKAGQPILSYVEEHKEKSGTPTMGGLFFVMAAVLAYFFFAGRSGRISYVVIAIGIAYLIVGFLDDFIKIKNRHNLGLRAYQKILFQLAIGIIAGVFCYLNGLTVFYLPFSMRYFDFSYWTIPLVAVVLIATTNSVNLTDGLDGLAGGVSIVYLALLFAVVSLQLANFKLNYLDESEYRSLLLLMICFIGGLAGFLCFNTNKARVFMGDTGSLSLGGFLGGLSIFREICCLFRCSALCLSSVAYPSSCRSYILNGQAVGSSSWRPCIIIFSIKGIRKRRFVTIIVWRRSSSGCFR